MHPDVLRDATPERNTLSKDLSLDTWRTDALRRLLSGSERYPHCPKCGRAMLAESAEQFRCPDRHATVTLKAPSRTDGVKRLFRLITRQPAGHSGT
jgi:tRNA(Ile2) C34 agmatinyltransferase TiaS